MIPHTLLCLGPKGNVMRPVDKLNVGDSIVIDAQQVTVQKDYEPYKEAKRILRGNIGCFCSYCELPLPEIASSHVEHIFPKANPAYAHLKTAWTNFLISCSTCNGAGNKGEKVCSRDCHFPHKNNTFKSFVYKRGGVVIVNPLLSGSAKQNAEELLRLVGLDKGPKNSSPADSRWQLRSKIWDIAEKNRTKYLSHCIDDDTVVDLAKGYGMWSIWYTVFNGCDSVRKALIDNFAGTSAKCFDLNNHYEPVDRNPGQIDPT